MKKLGLVLIVMGLLGCSGPKYNTKVLCEVKSGDKSLQFVQYEQNDYPNTPQFGGHSVRGAVLFKDEKHRGNNRSFMNGLVEGWVEYAQDACKGSSIDGDNIVIHPVHRHYKMTTQKLPLNRIVVSASAGDKFSLIELPEWGSPYLKDRTGAKELTYPKWITRTVSINTGTLVVEQVKILTAPFKYGEKKTGREIFDWWNLKGKDCDECEPVIARTLVSSDHGRNWVVNDFSIIKPEIIPADAVLPITDRRMFWFNPRGGDPQLVDCPEDLSSLAEWSRKVCKLGDSKVIPLE